MNYRLFLLGLKAIDDRKYFCLNNVEHVLSIYGLGVDIFICIFNVGIYILENVGQMGLPIPEKMKGVFQQLREK